jgi:hypothetical protein
MVGPEGFTVSPLCEKRILLVRDAAFSRGRWDLNRLNGLNG